VSCALPALAVFAQVDAFWLLYLRMSTSNASLLQALPSEVIYDRANVTSACWHAGPSMVSCSALFDMPVVMLPATDLR